MFTGIIQCVGEVVAIDHIAGNVQFKVASDFSNSLQVDQSVAHEGVCLTVTHIENNIHCVTAVPETLQKTNLSEWYIGKKVNLEKSLTLQSLIDGHLVQGHIDTTATCTEVLSGDEHWVFTYEFESDAFAHLFIEKGSIAINGTSLTCFECTARSFKVAIIPYTYYHTSIRDVRLGSKVNIEFDLIGKYLDRRMRLGKE